MTKVVLVVLLVVVGGLLAWLHWSPRHTAQQLGEAVRAADTATIVRLINFPKVHAQLVADIQAARDRVGPKPNMDSLSQSVPHVAWQLMRPRSGQAVDRAATPGGFIDMVTLAYWAPKDQPTPEPLWKGFVEFPATFEVGMLRPDQPRTDTARFVLRRNGLKWQVEQVRLYGLCHTDCR